MDNGRPDAPAIPEADLNESDVQPDIVGVLSSLTFMIALPRDEQLKKIFAGLEVPSVK
jgi:hypothetical protein